MKVGLYIKFIDTDKMNIDNLQKGNPGIGGTEYLFLLLALMLSNTNHYDVYIYSENRIENFASKLNNIVVNSIYAAIIQAKNDEIDIFIFPPSTEKNIYEFIEKNDLKTITWMQNRFTFDIANYIANSKNIIVNVCASREQYDCIIDHPLWYKSVMIKNCIFETDVGSNRERLEPIVTYMGHLSFNRGFHIVAKQWRKVLKKVPNAQLYVIGNANLYDTCCKFGDLGLADPDYEALIKRYITDSLGNVISSIAFCGRLGLEKYDVFDRTKVGIVNPLSREMGPLSALEMEACSIPVVSIRRYGQVETIAHNYSGLLVRNNKRLWKYIVRLLQDDGLHSQLSRNAKKYVHENYSPDLIIEQWNDLLNHIRNGLEVKPMMPMGHHFNDFKWLRIMNRLIMNKIKWINLPSMLYYEKILKSFKMR